MASRSSAYFHLLSSYFLVPAAALDAWTCGPLIQETEEGCKRWATKTHSWELWGTVSRWSFPPTPHHSLLRGSLLGSLKDCAMHPVGFFIGFPSIHDIKVTNLLGKKNLRVVLIVRISQLFIYLLAYMVTCLQSTLAPLHCLSIWLGRFRVGFCYTAYKLQSSVSQKSLRIWNVIAIYRCELFQQPSEEIKLSSLCSTYRMGSFISILKYWDKLQSCFRF